MHADAVRGSLSGAGSCGEDVHPAEVDRILARAFGWASRDRLVALWWRQRRAGWERWACEVAAGRPPPDRRALAGSGAVC